MKPSQTPPRAAPRLAPALLLPLAFLFVAVVLQTSARADTIQLTAGRVSYDRLDGEIRVVFSGQGFSVTNLLDEYPPQSGDNFSIGTFSGRAGVGRVTYNGVEMSAFVGSGSFTDTTISGRIIIFGNFDQSFGQPPFPITIDFFGTGFAQRTATGFVFNITSPVPEPATLVLLGTGLAGVAARARKRRKAQRADEDSPPV